MNAHIVLAHPEPRSYNAQLARVASEALSRAGCNVTVTDLYRDGFDPVERAGHFRERADHDWFRPQAEQRHASDRGTLPAEVQAEIARLRAAELVVFQFPLWWYGPPAILKGWFDRVLAYGETYRSKVRYDTGAFRGKRALVSVTAGAPAETFELNGRNGDMDLILWPLHFTLHYVGFTVLAPFVVHAVQGGISYSSESDMLANLEARKHSLDHYVTRIATGAPVEEVPFNVWADWDEAGRLRPDASGCSPFVRGGR